MVIHYLDLHEGVFYSSRIAALAFSNVAAYDTGTGVVEAVGCWDDIAWVVVRSAGYL